MDSRKKDEYAYSELVQTRVLTATRKRIEEYIKKHNKTMSEFLREAIHLRLMKEEDWKTIEAKVVAAMSFMREVDAHRMLSDRSTRETYMRFLLEIMNTNKNFRKLKKKLEAEKEE